MINTSLSDLARVVSEATSLKEGPDAVVRLLQVVAARGPISAKELSQSIGLPLPVVAAVRRELESRGILERKGGVVLTDDGKRLLEGQTYRFLGVCEACSGTGLLIPDELSPLLDKLRMYRANRPRVDVSLDQSFILPEYNLRRCLFALNHGLLAGKRVLFIGDDDASSLCVGMLAAYLGFHVDLTVLDVDHRILNYVQTACDEEEIEVKTIYHDARDPLPASISSKFDTVFIDPPYTLAGLELFLSRAVDALIKQEGSAVVLSFGRKPPSESVQIMEKICNMHLYVSDVRPGFNRYEGASVLAGASDIYLLRATHISKPTIRGRYTREIYTGDMRTKVRTYICTNCGSSYKIAPGEKWQTIEALKLEGCPRCGNRAFRRQSSKLSE